MNCRHAILFRDRFMGLHGEGRFTLLQRCQHAFIDEVSKDDVRVGICFPGLSDDALHSTDALFAGMVGILIIVHGKFDKKQIDRTLGKHICGEAEGSGG